ncbi:IclR family transcriptional regulator [Paracoccus sp. (in: a-proteobacteria)]|jgi:DNA-binding IclR family transcriptional regulator|uniref:IclR family transcriptional regulator n=1 Tax=Paracoccus sp. TaxID=267 RepID=UPI0035B0C3C1
MIAKTLANALDLLDYFTHEAPTWGVRELAKASNVHPAIVQRALTTFASRQFLTKDPVSQKYTLGARFLELAQVFRGHLSLSDMIRPMMQEISELSGETAFLCWLMQSQAVCIEICEAPDSIRFSIEVGTRFPLHAGANARVILAHLDEKTREGLLQGGLEPLTPDTITEPARMRDELALIRERGWSSSLGEFRADTFGLAVPLFSPGGNIVGSLSIAGPAYRRNEAAFPELIARMNAMRPRMESCLSP